MIKSFFVRRDVSDVIEEIWVATFTPGLTKPHTLYFSPRLFFTLLDRPRAWLSPNIMILCSAIVWVLTLQFQRVCLVLTSVVVDPFTNVGIMLGDFFLRIWWFLSLLFSVLMDFLCPRLTYQLASWTDMIVVLWSIKSVKSLVSALKRFVATGICWVRLSCVACKFFRWLGVLCILCPLCFWGCNRRQFALHSVLFFS